MRVASPIEISPALVVAFTSPAFVIKIARQGRLREQYVCFIRERQAIFGAQIVGHEIDLADGELVVKNEEFRELASKHHSLDSRLHELEAKHYLSDSEQFEDVSIKKRKLQLKDRMERMLREHIDRMTGSTVRH